jgi:hypothetical protein
MRLLALLLLLPGLALAQGLAYASPKALSPQPQSGPVLVEDAGTVVHVYWNGTALVDTKGTAWTMTGTVPMVARAKNRPAGAGPYSVANFYTTTNIADPFDFVANYTCTIIFTPTTVAGNQVLINSGLAGTSGFYIQITAGVMWHGVSVPTANSAQAPLPVAGFRTVASFGRDNTNAYIKVNNTLTGKLASALAVSTSGVTTSLGRYSGGAQDFSGTIHELLCSTTTWDESLVSNTQRRALNMR